MEPNFKTQLFSNSIKYKRSLERIVEKYSKLQYQDGGIEVDLNSTNMKSIQRYMEMSKTELSKLESKSLMDLRDVSLTSSHQDSTTNSPLDFTLQDSGADETCVSGISTQFSAEEDDATTGQGDTTQLTVSSLDESRRNISRMELQPEDEDEELEMTLRSHGSSLAELYPSMINRLKQACSRHHASEAADLVLRRYRRWRQQPNLSGLNKTFFLPLSQRTTSEERLGSPLKIRATPLKIATTRPQARQHSPGRMRREQLQPVLVMDFSCTSESSKSKGFSLNQQPSSLAFSPSRPLHPPPERSLRPKRLSVAAHSPQADGSSTYVRSTSAFGSPLRQSPLKASAQQHEPQDTWQQPNRSGLNKTFFLPLSQKTTSVERLGSPLKICATPESPLKIATTRPRARQHSPGRMRREQSQPVLVMDFSCTSESSKSKGFSLNQTLNVSEREEQPSSLAFSPSRPLHPPPELSLRSKRLSVAAHSPQADGSSTYVRSTSAFGSPLRQSPLKAAVVPSLSRSPRASWRSPAARSVEGFSGEPVRPRSMSDSLPSSPKMPVRMLCPQDSHLSLRSHSGRHRLRRHLSFDSSLPTSCASYSPKQIDEEFTKLYHRFVCQNKLYRFHGPPCRLCGRSFEHSRSHSSSSLAALALSPHRSLLRKRHRELSWDSHPQSKRLRDECYVSSPGSKRRVKEMLRCRLSPFESEQPRDGFSFSSSNCSLMSKFSAQQPGPQETWLSRGHSVPAGCSAESLVADGVVLPPTVRPAGTSGERGTGSRPLKYHSHNCSHFNMKSKCGDCIV